MKKLTTMFKNPFSFKGRIRRTEYWLTSIIYGVLYFTFYIMLSSYPSEGTITIVGLLFLPYWWVLLASNVKRSHDIGNSGWYVLIPFYGLLLAFMGSDGGDNKYGLNPKN